MDRLESGRDRDELCFEWAMQRLCCMNHSLTGRIGTLGVLLLPPIRRGG